MTRHDSPSTRAVQENGPVLVHRRVEEDDEHDESPRATYRENRIHNALNRT